jgi:hypothetical protein
LGLKLVPWPLSSQCLSASVVNPPAGATLQKRVLLLPGFEPRPFFPLQARRS